MTIIINKLVTLFFGYPSCQLESIHHKRFSTQPVLHACFPSRFQHAQRFSTTLRTYKFRTSTSPSTRAWSDTLSLLSCTSELPAGALLHIPIHHIRSSAICHAGKAELYSVWIASRDSDMLKQLANEASNSATRVRSSVCEPICTKFYLTGVRFCSGLKRNRLM